MGILDISVPITPVPIQAFLEYSSLEHLPVAAEEVQSREDFTVV